MFGPTDREIHRGANNLLLHHRLREAGTASDMPALRGSPKQIVWASVLRESYITVMSKTHSESVARTVAEHTDASYWINNRFGLGVTNAQQREIQQLWKRS